MIKQLFNFFFRRRKGYFDTSKGSWVFPQIHIIKMKTKQITIIKKHSDGDNRKLVFIKNGFYYVGKAKDIQGIKVREERK